MRLGTQRAENCQLRVPTSCSHLRYEQLPADQIAVLCRHLGWASVSDFEGPPVALFPGDARVSTNQNLPGVMSTDDFLAAFRNLFPKFGKHFKPEFRHARQVAVHVCVAVVGGRVPVPATESRGSAVSALVRAPQVLTAHVNAPLGGFPPCAPPPRPGATHMFPSSDMPT